MHDPLYTDAELHALGFAPLTTSARPSTPRSSTPITPRYADLTLADLPGVRVVIDGRELLPGLGEGVVVRTLGKPAVLARDAAVAERKPC